jgi:UDP-2-acetamido-3-amino-2,3-dideoxy-glucuronate N-acetyltransferase
MLASVDDLRPVSFRMFCDPRGALVPMELAQSIPFQVVRFFWIFDVPPGEVRGSHAHKLCHQYLVCAVGSLRVDAFDGRAERSIVLAAGQALHVPPALFTVERFDAPGTVLMVFCDRTYEVGDYLTSREALAAYRRGVVAAPADRLPGEPDVRSGS